jgi:phenylpyruvate tautomerase PptA (4-oxalocrotonate tautomerase family)
MPILEVEIISLTEDDDVEGIARRIAEAAAAVFRSKPAETWVKLTVIPIERYAENAGGPPAGVLPVFVRVLKRKLPRGSELRIEAQALTEAVAEVCGRPVENVHLEFAPDAQGRVAFGGRIVAD